MSPGHEVAPAEATKDGQILRRVEHRLGELGLGTLMVLFTAASAFPPSGDYFIPWVTIPTFALASLHFLGRALDSSSRVLIDEEGVTDRTSIMGGALRVPWSQVRGVTISRWHNGVQLEVSELAELEKATGLRRRLGIRLARLAGKRTINLDTTLLGISKPELHRRLLSELDRYERRDLGLADQVGLPPAESV